MLLLTMLLAVVLGAPVDYLARKGLSRVLATLAVIATLLALVPLMVRLVAPIIAGQIRRLTDDELSRRVEPFLEEPLPEGREAAALEVIREEARTLSDAPRLLREVLGPVDPAVFADELPGSSVEVFGSKPNTLAIGQVFLVPAANGKNAAGYLAEPGGQDLKAEIQVKSETTETGYTLQAIVPLRFLKLAAADGRFLLEFQVDSNVRGQGMEYQTMFNSKLAYENNQSYGLFSFEPAKKKEK